MASEESARDTSNLKVPPLKIVLSGHQSNSVLNVSSEECQESDTPQKRDNKLNDDIINEQANPTDLLSDSLDTSESNDKFEKRCSKSTNDTSETDTQSIKQMDVQKSLSADSSTSDSESNRSNTSSPSSEPESMASNSTIISDNQQNKSKSESKTSTNGVKSEKINNKAPRSLNEKQATSANGQANLTSRKETFGHSSESTSTEGSYQTTKESTSSTNQRITRSSQRAAQQNKGDSHTDSNVEESTVPESNQLDKSQESVRKVKRRKNDNQESEPSDPNQATTANTIQLLTFHPEDYELPKQNSFELYRDIRKLPFKKLMKLNHIQPRVPHGFKEYRLSGGPYLLDGNKLGLGVNGSRIDNPMSTYRSSQDSSESGQKLTLRVKLSNLRYKLFLQQTPQQAHSAYVIPKISDVPKTIQEDSSLHELYQEQERARHKMRMQHLKERERSILAAEQEILRTHNRAANTDQKQTIPLSACTYLYYQERYHYVDDKMVDITDKIHGSSETAVVTGSQVNGEKPIGENKTSNDSTDSTVSHKNPVSSDDSTTNNKQPISISTEGTSPALDDAQPEPKPQTTNLESSDINNKRDAITESDRNVKDSHNLQNQQVKNSEHSDSSQARKSSDETDSDSKVIDKDMFLEQLQKIDDKWDSIRRDMYIRHKNESDSLYAVQTLEWEWKAKEIGVCDVRISPKIEYEFVPRVEVSLEEY